MQTYQNGQAEVTYIGDWLYTEMVYPATDRHPSQY